MSEVNSMDALTAIPSVQELAALRSQLVESNQRIDALCKEAIARTAEVDKMMLTFAKAGADILEQRERLVQAGDGLAGAVKLLGRNNPSEGIDMVLDAWVEARGLVTTPTTDE